VAGAGQRPLDNRRAADTGHRGYLRLKHTRVSEGWLERIFPDLPEWPPDFCLFTYTGSEPDRTAQWLRWNEFAGHLRMVLLKADRASMYRSLEVKAPLMSELGLHGPCAAQLPDLVVQWSDRVVAPLAGVVSPRFGEVSSPGWGTGRTGCHTGDAWALVIPGFSNPRSPAKSPHIVDIASTVCAALGVDTDGLAGQPLLEPAAAAVRHRTAKATTLVS
jgi:hypothetical protein